MNNHTVLDTEDYWRRFTKGDPVLRIPKEEALLLLKEIDYLRARVAELEAASADSAAGWMDRAERAEGEVELLRDSFIEAIKKLTAPRIRPPAPAPRAAPASPPEEP